MAYCTVQDLYAYFGRTNITKYADADNRGNATDITARINAKIDEATDFIDCRLGVIYDVPLVIVPKRIKTICTQLAGVYLYKYPRGIVDGNDESGEIAALEQKCEDTLTKILMRILDVPGLTPAVIDYPEVVVNDNQSEIE